ncbi:hypothetical protein [Bailinhaonella thermotolerans]|uniref:Uncharacterized protein n=1 Tax=Bailinhaonella thermotolerans TaxID=1070861 RepID=A0A3A4B5S6_9ACTN|nr:hypothetical protein [Bailinhaonella thermotolerans]RJL33401.1 hypothetical protein D5H75_11460 [Bailinhaonella thermotolerans]
MTTRTAMKALLAAATTGALALAAAPAPAAAAVPARAGATARQAVYHEIVLGSLEALDLEESGEDEVRIEIKAQDGEHWYAWPTNEDEIDTKRYTCWILTSSAEGCSPGSVRRAGGPYAHVYAPEGARFVIEVWEDDHIGDDRLLQIPVQVHGPGDISGSSPAGKGFDYRLTARLVTAEWITPPAGAELLRAPS